MDAVQEFATKLSLPVPKKFVVGGASKRGWTTWTTAAVDTERVVGAIPIVLDILNLQANLHHHYRSLAGWTFAFADYYQLNITKLTDSPNLKAMGAIVDPYSYLERYRNTKLLQIQSAGDEFFLPDNELLFWNDLQSATGGTNLLSNGPKPISAIGYKARTLNAKRRDFRLVIGDPNHPGKAIVNPVFWLTQAIGQQVVNSTKTVYTLTIANPLEGWEGFFIQVNFPGPQGTALELTTETLIIPDTYPTDDCSGDGCYGTLV
ncbi:unnamed protein product [Didymodactylos carnosus]|uniref:Uncharacterized protein n=1 Tax=Didymodactylos carnosus TaxID=1234261 RepID=A0A814PLP3_9BILA|nr:unnamed protein product [Didymodactylos carnosus]CAF3872294.1 unnamed protein product [Didymodactylos carnosus]